MLASAHTRPATPAQAVGYGLFAVCAFACLLLLFAPSQASAQTANACSAPTVGNFTPFVYDGELHSFEYSIADDEEHLPETIVIDGTEISLRYASVWDEKIAGQRVVHVDVPHFDLPTIEGNTSIIVENTQVPPPPGSGPCTSEAVFSLELPTRPAPQPPTETPTQPEPTTPDTTGTGSDADDEPSEPGTGEPDTDTTPDGENGDGTPGNGTPDETDTTGGETDDDGSFLGGFGTPIRGAGGLCVSAPLSAWLVLGVVALLVALATLLYMPRIAQSNALLATSILAPLVLFLGIWYFFDGCRVFMWFPIAILIISLGTLIGSGMPFFLTGGVREWGSRMREKFSRTEKSKTFTSTPKKENNPHPEGSSGADAVSSAPGASLAPIAMPAETDTTTDETDPKDQAPDAKTDSNTTPEEETDRKGQDKNAPSEQGTQDKKKGE